MFRLTFLGTSAGTPTLRRNVSALAIQTGQRKAWILVDCGEATQHQLLRTRLSVRDLQTICITHAHGDHCYGLPGILASAAMHGRTAALALIAPQCVLDWLQATIRLTSLHLPFALHTTAVESCASEAESAVTESDKCRTGAEYGGYGDSSCLLQQWRENTATHTLEIRACPLRHRVPSYGYVINRTTCNRQLNPGRLGVAAGSSWGKLQRGQSIVLQDGSTLHSAEVTAYKQTRLRMVVGGDNADMRCLISACTGAQLLVHEATYTQDVLAKVGSARLHSCARDVAAFAERMQLPNLILTHISPRYTHAEGEQLLLDEARQAYTGKLHLARDFAQFSLTTSELKSL